ncbi:hypothetical protein ScPMuIL_011560, partial [Solemya velum]
EFLNIKSMMQCSHLCTLDEACVSFLYKQDGLCQLHNATCSNIPGGYAATTFGVYKIKPHDAEEPFSVYCDMDMDGGGWAVIQRRQDGSVDFYRNWTEYETGFGNLTEEFWLGNRYIHTMTGGGDYELRVDLADWEGNSRFAKYSNFSVGNTASNYELTVGGYSGDAGDSLEDDNNWPFTTQDRDHDGYSGGNCAVYCTGAWWYHGCSYSNLNGRYYHVEHITWDWDGVYWHHWRGGDYSLRSTTMSVRRRN